MSVPAFTAEIHTIEWWAKDPSTGGGCYIGVNEVWNGSNWVILDNFPISQFYISWYHGDSWGNQWYSPYPSFIHDGNWHHFAMVEDAGTLTIYIDGVSGGSGSVPSGALSLNGNSQVVFANYSYGYGAPWGGTIDEMRFSANVRYSDTFTPSCTLGTDSNTVAYWKFDHSSDPTVTDASGNGHDGTMQGSPLPTWASGVTCTGGGSMNMVSRGGSSMLLGRGTTGSQSINLRPTIMPVILSNSSTLILSNSPTVNLTNSPINGSSITITDTLGRVWGLLSHP